MSADTREAEPEECTRNPEAGGSAISPVGWEMRRLGDHLTFLKNGITRALNSPSKGWCGISTTGTSTPRRRPT